MKSLFSKASLKSNLRHLFVGVAFVESAAQTYLANGNTFGFNKETVVGVAAQALIALIALAQRWTDKNDPAFGRIAKVVADEAIAKLEPLTEPPATLLNTALPVPLMAPAGPSVEVTAVVNPQ